MVNGDILRRCVKILSTESLEHLDGQVTHDMLVAMQTEMDGAKDAREQLEIIGRHI